MGYFQGEYPPGVKDDFARYAAVNESMVRAHRLAVDALRSGPGDFPVGLTLSMAEITADEGGEAVRDAAEEMLENVFLRATGDDDFVGVQCYTRMHFGPEGWPGTIPTVAVTQMGDERWPQAVEHTVRRAAAVSGRPVVVTENGIATDDDTRADLLSGRGPRRARIAAWPRASTCGGTSSGACWTTSSGIWATGPSSASSPWPRAPSSGGPNPAPTGSARWPGPTRWSSPPA